MTQGYICANPEEGSLCEGAFALLDTTLWWDNTIQGWELPDDFLTQEIYCSNCGGGMEDVVV